MSSLEKRVAAIEARNKRVELDKAWETSWTRRVSIAVLTYGVVVGFLIIIENDTPFVNAVVPVVGFLLSTLAMRVVRSLWQK